ncbi:hypothetical protein IFM89_000476 [Coptis chinensis]|uniref:Protein FLX-like 2 n=1 Tax=Coptis chinensis TaxID=261450 RepID=A0A835H1L7_9MAGN|nr:hypothetical protein IFM89_000476 [Coptis chinensis]
MGSKGRIPPHLRRPLSGPDMMHPDLFGPGGGGGGGRPPPGAYPPFDVLPPPELLEQKLDAQLVEMQALATENRRLANTHGTLRQDLAAAQQELQKLQYHIAAVKNEREHQFRGLVDKISKMEVEFQAAEPVKMELQQARADAQNLIVARQELMTKVQQLTQDLKRTHSEVQVPALMSELDGLRQEYQRCRETYDYEKKLYNDHFQSLQLMENNYISMARELEKLRAELANTANLERQSAPYGAPTGYKENETAGQNPYGSTGYKENEAAGHHSYGGPTGYKDNEAAVQHHYGVPTGYKENEVAGHHSYSAPTGHKDNEAAGQHLAGQNAYEDGYAASQVRGAPPPPYGGPGAVPVGVGAAAPPYGGPGAVPAGAAPPYGGPSAAPAGSAPPYGGPGAAPAHAGYGAGYDAQRGPVYDPSRGPGYDASVRGPGYGRTPRTASDLKARWLHQQILHNMGAAQSVEPKRKAASYCGCWQGLEFPYKNSFETEMTDVSLIFEISPRQNVIPSSVHLERLHKIFEFLETPSTGDMPGFCWDGIPNSTGD